MPPASLWSWRARRSTKGPRKYDYATAFRSEVGDLEFAVGLALRLRDARLARATDRQLETMRAMWRLDTQERVADRLGIDESTVSRTLRRGGGWEVEDVDRTVEALLEGIGGPGPAGDDADAEG